MRRYLVVANQTLGSRPLARLIEDAMRAGPCSFHVVVPATHPRDHMTWTEGEARAIAQERLDRALAWFGELGAYVSGAEVSGAVGDGRPMLAIGDALIEQAFDEIVISTLPAGASRWLKQDLPVRAERKFGLPVTHVIAEPAATERLA